ncbi:hypothetical protein [Actinoplanes sp. DH11]|uniref:hypothetical protein n=1 Tax=Actinoplanes sp. DH11 TaxID=2857011 RepID=UPI001E599C20|nr:hypothetical protein [Actinoplanes sp. DH11]
MTVRVVPIMPVDVPRVAEFLHRHLNNRLSAATWARSIIPPWPVESPNHGFMLIRDDTEVVGAYLAFYANRVIDGQPAAFCNLAGWCVLPEHRFHSVRLLKALLAQDGYHFTDLSPSGSVVPINTRLGFETLDTTLLAVPNLPWPAVPGRVRVSSDPRVLERTLTGAERQLYRDHRAAAAARHVVMRYGNRWCYVVFRRDRPKNLPLFASIIHVSDQVVFRRGFRQLSRHLLLRHGLPATLVELRLAGHRPALAVTLGTPRHKMYRSASLKPDQIDYLYSELACVPF